MCWPFQPAFLIPQELPVKRTKQAGHCADARVNVKADQNQLQRKKESRNSSTLSPSVFCTCLLEKSPGVFLEQAIPHHYEGLGVGAFSKMEGWGPEDSLFSGTKNPCP